MVHGGRQLSAGPLGRGAEHQAPSNMPSDDSILFLVEHPDVRAELLGLIRRFLARQLSLHDFWKSYNFLYADVPAGALPDAEMDFFSAVNDRLHYADSESPPDSALEGSNEFASWLSRGFDAFESGTWTPPDG